MPLGGLALQDVSGGSLKKAAADRARGPRDAHRNISNTCTGRTFYAVGGTWRALARLHQAARDYPLHVMHGYIIDPEDGLDFLHLVEEADAKTLKDIESVSEARRPLLAYGAIVLEEIIRLGEPKEVAISAFGVREGAALRPARSRETRERDPLLAAASDLNLLRSRSPRHGEELCQWTDAFIRSLRPAGDGRRARACATRPACSPISAGAPIPITGASRASTSSPTAPSPGSTIRAAPIWRCRSSSGTRASRPTR